MGDDMVKIAVSKKVQGTLASVIVATAATVTPIVAHAAPTSGQTAQDESTSDSNTASSTGSRPNGRGGAGNQSNAGASDSGTTPAPRPNAPRSRAARPAAATPGSGTAVDPTPSAPSNSSATPGTGSVAPVAPSGPSADSSAAAAADLGPIGNLIQVTVQVGAQLTYGFLDTTAGVLKLVGNYITTIPIIGPAIGNVFIVVSDSFNNAAYAVAKTFHVGPYIG